MKQIILQLSAMSIEYTPLETKQETVKKTSKACVYTLTTDSRVTSINRKCLSYNSIQRKCLSYNSIHQIYGKMLIIQYHTISKHH